MCHYDLDSQEFTLKIKNLDITKVLKKFYSRIKKYESVEDLDNEIIYKETGDILVSQITCENENMTFQIPQNQAGSVNIEEFVDEVSGEGGIPYCMLMNFSKPEAYCNSKPPTIDNLKPIEKASCRY